MALPLCRTRRPGRVGHGCIPDSSTQEWHDARVCNTQPAGRQTCGSVSTQMLDDVSVCSTGAQHDGCCSQPHETLMNKPLGQNWVHSMHQTSKPCYAVAVSWWASVLMHTDTRVGCSCCTHSAAQSQKYLQQQRHPSSTSTSPKASDHTGSSMHTTTHTQTGQPHAGAAPVRKQTIYTPLATRLTCRQTPRSQAPHRSSCPPFRRSDWPPHALWGSGCRCGALPRARQ